ncbi:MAG TPA: TlpA disulfide reductase family protein [Polyangiaceae bacterium]|jgi:thiol-disulfide isomerase/thioredoxin|nr:TlpA disulfide reductase family protein [Polyangiaceae bacterium]
MSESGKTATASQATVVIGSVLALSMVLGYAILPLFKTQRSKLVGLPAAGFTLPVMSGGEPGSRVSLSDLRGKVVVLDFWASWCAPCRAEVPIVDRVARHHEGKGVVVLGVTTSDDDWPRAVEFATSHQLGYATIFDDGDHVANAFQVRELPTLVVIDKTGVVSAVRPRMVHEDELEELIAEAEKVEGS